MTGQTPEFSTRRWRAQPVPFPASAEEVDRLVAMAMDLVPAKAPAPHQRIETRFPVRFMAPAEVYHPGGSSRSSMVVVHDISEHGLGMIYPGFLHQTTLCRLQLEGFAGVAEEVEGVVVSSTYLSGPYHRVGLQLSTSVDPRHYVDHEVLHALLTDTREFTQEAESGVVLCVDDQEVDLDLYELALGETLTVVKVRDPGAAIDANRRRPFDLAVVDLHLGSHSGIDLIRTLRADGFFGPVLLVTVETRASMLDAARAAGATDILMKPFRREQLVNTVYRCLRRHSSPWGGSRPIYSDLGPQASAQVERYVQQVRRYADALEQGIGENGAETAREVCVRLRGTGTGYGFEILSDAATEAIRAIDSSGSTVDARAELLSLIQVCRRLTTGQPPDEH